MDIRNSLDGLRSLLGVNQPAAQAAPPKSSATTNASSFSSDLATLSSAGSTVSQAASGEDVRMDKVAAVQSALAAGIYNVPASAVASKLVDFMIGGAQ